MKRQGKALAVVAAIFCAAAIGLGGARPADAHHFGHFGFGFGFGYPVIYGPAVYVAPPPPIYPVYAPAYAAPPPVAYGYRRVYVHRYYRHVVHHRHYCSCHCCR